jgi:hypothetical protein
MDMGVHGTLDAINKPAKREDSATLIIVLALTLLPIMCCLN